MGFFSWKCRGCGESIKAPGTCKHMVWQNVAVAQKSLGTRLVGRYDGYGSVDGYEFEGDVEMWHRECWIKAGKPNFTGYSDPADDQGCFYECPECKAITVHQDDGFKIVCNRKKIADGQFRGGWACEQEMCIHYVPRQYRGYVGDCNHSDTESESPLKK